MKILAFDTSNNTASVAISEGQNILAYNEELRPSMQAERLLPMIEDTLAYSGLSYQQIDYLGVINGPGSFTGIRIGLAAAQGILLPTKIKGTAVTTFEMAYFRACMQVKIYHKIIVIINAYRAQLYTQIFDRGGNSSKALLIDCNAMIELLSKENYPITLVGNGIEIIYDQIKHLPNIIVLPRFTKVKALHICRYIDNKILKGSPLSPLEALYIRPADAKI